MFFFWTSVWQFIFFDPIILISRNLPNPQKTREVRIFITGLFTTEKLQETCLCDDKGQIKSLFDGVLEFFSQFAFKFAVRYANLCCQRLPTCWQRNINTWLRGGHLGFVLGPIVVLLLFTLDKSAGGGKGLQRGPRPRQSFSPSQGANPTLTDSLGGN